MNPEKIIAGLTAAQADGLACVVCGRDYRRASGTVSLVVGRSMTGSQVFACEGRCGEVVGADPTMACRRGGGDRDERHAERRTAGA